jgi:tagatose 1,6-diphosphate aldolase
MLDKEHPEFVSYQTMVSYKMELCRALAPYASAVLLDPVYGAAQAVASGVLPSSTGLLVSIEATGYGGSDDRRITELLPHWSVEKIKRMGGSAVKLLLYYRPDIADIAAKQLHTVEMLADDCLQADIPFVVEPKSYTVGEEPEEFARVKPQLVIETAQQVTALPVDVLKAEFPAELQYEKDEGRLLGLCRQLSEASRVPWVILSAGVDFELFRREVEIACKGGASGFLAGRALWQESTRIPSPAERAKFLEHTVVHRLKQLAEIANAYGTPWYAKFGFERDALTPIAEGWYKDY